MLRVQHSENWSALAFSTKTTKRNHDTNEKITKKTVKTCFESTR